MTETGDQYTTLIRSKRLKNKYAGRTDSARIQTINKIDTRNTDFTPFLNLCFTSVYENSGKT